MSNAFEEKALIRELQSDYCFRMDDADFGGVAALFTQGGEWRTPYQSAKGRDEIESVLVRINPVKGEGPVRKHLLGNGLITLDGDTATARTSYFVFADSGEGPVAVVVGTYEDRLTRAGNGWLLAERVLVHEIAGDLKLRL